MRLPLAILTTLALTGCVTVSLALPTRGGHATASTDGNARFFFYFKK